MPFTDLTSSYRQPTPEAANMPRPAIGVTSGGNKPWRRLLERLRESVKTGDSDAVLAAFTEYVPQANAETRGQIDAALARAKATANEHDTATRAAIQQRIAVQQETAQPAQGLRDSLNRYPVATRAFLTDTLNNNDSLRHAHELATDRSFKGSLAGLPQGKPFNEAWAQAKAQVQGGK